MGAAEAAVIVMEAVATATATRIRGEKMQKFITILRLLALLIASVPALTFGSSFSKYPQVPLLKLSNDWKLLELYTEGDSSARVCYGKPSTHLRGITALISGEPSSLSLDSYGRAAKKAVESNIKASWTRLGKTSIKGQNGILAEVCESSAFGNLKMLQWITIKDSFVYVVTIGAHESEYSIRRKELMDILYTFELKDSPLDWLDPKKHSFLTSVFDSLSRQVRAIALRGMTANPAPNNKDASAQTCASVLLDALPDEGQNQKAQELMQTFFRSKIFQKKLWPAYSEVLSKHFKALGPAWETEMQLYIASRYFGF